jgi:hypothetical protein
MPKVMDLDRRSRARCNLAWSAKGIDSQPLLLRRMSLGGCLPR